MTSILAFAFLPTPIIIVLLLLTMGFALYAQIRVSSAYDKNVKIPSRGRITGREAAEAVMAQAGITNVEITETRGHLTDHYDPTHRRLVLSSENYRGTSLAALGVAAHEAGHAIQHKVGYSMLKTRMALVPVTMFTSQFLPIIMFAGFFFGGFGRGGGLILDIGIMCYAVLTLFQLVTLPVEFDASRRAKVELVKLGIVDRDEMPGVNQTLNAAALTYVAAFLGALLHLLYLLSLRRND
ncbi:zinc metallopeptidase [Horticoccus luteus]|uniref:Zinc metallopeptidase n=1 Tax=Horticoccus luteus TaxID=2862869 RepID=A0A8F9TYR1_9BACT|nr:zinc metallopeptidase [Horticoccus luteus]QYM80329.1 zinc metallopeptidase [Horticoccus luteus]